jgi:hypothetical protein
MRYIETRETRKTLPAPARRSLTKHNEKELAYMFDRFSVQEQIKVSTGELRGYIILGTGEVTFAFILGGTLTEHLLGRVIRRIISPRGLTMFRRRFTNSRTVRITNGKRVPES